MDRTMIAGEINFGMRVEVRQHWDIPWCCIGDFNVIRFPSERLGCISFRSAMLDFSQFIEDLSLIDLPLEGGQFTWFSGTNNPSMSTIDRASVSTDWEEHFSDIIQRVLRHPISYHNPLLLDAGDLVRGKSPIRFENKWLKKEGCVERMQAWWDWYSFSGMPSFVLANFILLYINLLQFPHVFKNFTCHFYLVNPTTEKLRLYLV